MFKEAQLARYGIWQQLSSLSISHPGPISDPTHTAGSQAAHLSLRTLSTTPVLNTHIVPVLRRADPRTRSSLRAPSAHGVIGTVDTLSHTGILSSSQDFCFSALEQVQPCKHDHQRLDIGCWLLETAGGGGIHSRSTNTIQHHLLSQEASALQVDLRAFIVTFLAPIAIGSIDICDTHARCLDSPQSKDQTRRLCPHTQTFYITAFIHSSTIPITYLLTTRSSHFGRKTPTSSISLLS
ncbi:hypothetical protein BDZ97DRAFT_1914293 [Flammula alnicola]|nr:hypothetical protein BDZ97DRAFT_1914293 [Flammula alnicola]